MTYLTYYYLMQLVSRCLMDYKSVHAPVITYEYDMKSNEYPVI